MPNLPQATVVETLPKRKFYASKARKPLSRKSGLSKKKRPLKRKIKRSSLVSKLDAIFSTWVRISHAKNGIVSCYTCPTVNDVKKMQNGHYVSRSVRTLRWEPDNCRPQCYGCNVMHGGQPITFRENLVKEMGEQAVLTLENRRHVLFTPSDQWLTEQIAHYEALTNSYTSS